jgi:hypothetical protein
LSPRSPSLAHLDREGKFQTIPARESRPDSPPSGVIWLFSSFFGKENGKVEAIQAFNRYHLDGEEGAMGGDRKTWGTIKGGVLLLAGLVMLLPLLQRPAAMAEETPKVVVIPMGSDVMQVPVQKELYVPALSFRPLVSMTTWQYEAGGGVIRPTTSTITTNWIAPLLLPMGAKIISVELLWKNVTYRNGATHLALRIFSEATVASLDLFNMHSTLATEGVHSVSISPNFTITDPFHPMIYASLTNEDRWLIGAKVVYSE